MNSKKGCPLNKISSLQDRSATNYNYIVKINNYKTINMAEDTPVQQNSLYRTINTTADTPEHKINNYRTPSELQVPPVHQIKHFNTIFITEDAPEHKFQLFQDHHNK